MLTDPTMPGFGCRVRPSGAKTFVYTYRNLARKTRRYTIGTIGHLTLDQARKLARDIAYRVRCDEDPAATKTKARKMTVEAIYAEYDEHKLAHLSTGHQTRIRGIFQSLVVPDIGHVPINAVSRANIRDLTDKKIAVGKNAMANNVHRAVSAFLTWCHVDRGYLSANPLYGIPLPHRHRSRERYLEDHELAEVWRACSQLNSQWCAAIRLLMLTGMRRTEVLGAESREIDLQRRVWTIPDERSKNRRAHRVHLTQQAIDIIKDVPKFGRQQYLFQSDRTETAKSVAETTASIRKIKQLVPIEDWCLHDLRRSVSSHMGSLGIPIHVIEVVLNHRSGYRSGVAGIYNRYDYAREARTAWELWAETLEAWVKKTHPRARAFSDEEAVLL